MTTIACDGKIMVADGQVTNGSTVSAARFEKLVRCKDGSIVGVAGCAASMSNMVQYLDQEVDKLDVHEDCCALLLRPNGKLFYVDEKGRQFEYPVPAAIGSGADIALGAMLAGVDAFDAVVVACERDVFSGGEISMLGLDDA